MSTSHNRNPSGRNQHGRVVKADDPQLRAALEKYHREGLTNDQKISARLLREYKIEIGPHSVKRRRKDLNLLAARYAAKDLTYEEKAQLILDILDKDTNNNWGVENVKARVAFMHSIHLPRPFVSDVMHTYAPEGFSQREPGSKRVLRVPKAPIGIHERWAGDGHDKLYKIGFPIWALVDDATGKWLGAWVVPSNRLNHIISYLFLATVVKYGGVPLQVSTDCGSETTGVYGLANALRREYHGDIDSTVLKAHEYVRSIHNISIERSWNRLRMDWGNNAVSVFQQGIDEGIYQPSDPAQFELVQWLWSRLLQQELATFMEFRNGVRMRKDSSKAGPSGMSRNDAFSLYESWGGSDCLLAIADCAPIKVIMEILGGPSILEFVSADYAQLAEAALERLGITTVDMGNIWIVFRDVLQELQTL